MTFFMIEALHTLIGTNVCVRRPLDVAVISSYVGNAFEQNCVSVCFTSTRKIAT